MLNPAENHVLSSALALALRRRKPELLIAVLAVYERRWLERSDPARNMSMTKVSDYGTA